MNRFKEHVYIIPEDDRDRQIAVGFVRHHGVKDDPIKVMPPAGGWPNVLKTFKDEYVQKLRNNEKAHVVMLIDFDEQFEDRKKKFDDAIPSELKERVFVIGSKNTPETLGAALNKTARKIGEALAEDCDAGRAGDWGHEQLAHNEPERKRLEETVKPFLFEK